MNSLIQLKETTPLLLIVLVLACFGLLPQMQAVSPDPDGCYPNFTTAEGCRALESLNTGEGNTGLGFWALILDTTGNHNTAVGAQALAMNNGDLNTAVGTVALVYNIDGIRNTAVGAQTLPFNDGDVNGAFGAYALFNNITGSANNAFGDHALFENISGSGNTAVGVSALKNNNANGNTATGALALLANTTGGTLGNTMGFDVGPNVAVGSGALGSNTIASANTAVGYQALGSNTTGFQDTDLGVSTAVGFQALANASGPADAANDAFGYKALFNLTDGTGNVAIGFQALSNLTGGFSNVAIGGSALNSMTTGISNVALGTGAGVDITSGGGNIYIGFNAGSGIVSEDATIRIGSTHLFAPMACYIQGIHDVVDPAADLEVLIAPDGRLSGGPISSARFKEDMKPMDKASESILALNPVTFRYKNDARRIPRFGLVAEEVARVNPNLVIPDPDGKPYSVRYEAVNAMLLNEFLKEHRKVQELETTVAQQQKSFESKLAEQHKQIEALTSGLRKVSAQLEASKPAPQVVNNP